MMFSRYDESKKRKLRVLTACTFKGVKRLTSIHQLSKFETTLKRIQVLSCSRQ